MLRDESTPEGKRIWADVDAIASRAPAWIRSHVEQAVRECRERIRQRIAAGAELGGAGPEDAQNVRDFAAEQARVMALTDD